ncbi:partner and localizer of BRCA2 [Antennarius striatus]|uniref:partner and localizer of BRCA2 n=1 Tax=Antennarius striatus TaxID=241820 RepID=UPI0035B327EA
MERNVADILHCEEQLRTTLHCDDKEKLRRKLALLQKEYLRTVQRLQRAERSEAVRKHVRSRIAEQNHQDQRNPEVTSNPSCKSASPGLHTPNRAASGLPQDQRDTGGPTDSDTRTPQVIRFSLPSDGPQTTHPCCDATKAHRPSPALRLRSRRSRLRWEKRSTEAGTIVDISEEGREQSERMETDQGREGRLKNEGTEVESKNEDQLSGTESESPSLLLSHWNTCGKDNTGDMEGEEKLGRPEQSEKEAELRSEGGKEAESVSLLLTCETPDIQTDGRNQDSTLNRGRKERGGEEDGENSRQKDGRSCDSRDKNTHQNETKKMEHKDIPENSVEKKEEKSGCEVKGAGLLESCTLVEGLLFPAEYYIRTTRRMTSSQSQPDVQAVILSQLNIGRHRRSRGRGKGWNGRAPSPSAGRRVDSSPAADASAGLRSQSSGETSVPNSASQMDVGSCVSPAIATAPPSRGRKRRRSWSRRRRAQTPRRSLSLDSHQLSPGETFPATDASQPASTHSTATQPCPGGNTAQSESGSAAAHGVYPIFLNSSRTSRSSQMSADSFQSLLLPSSPSSQTSLLPPPSLSLGPLAKKLMTFDIVQDFHLPDDQFAFLKLHKLRQVAVESGVELFASPSSNTRSSIRRYETHRDGGDPVTPLPLPLSLTPTTSCSSNLAEGKQDASQSVDVQNVIRERQPTGEPTGRASPEETSSRDALREQQTDHPHPKCEDDQVHDGDDRLDHYTEKNFVSLSSPGQTNVERSLKTQPHINVTDRPGGQKDLTLSRVEEPAGLVRTLEDQTSISHQSEAKAVTLQACDDREGPAESPAPHQKEKPPPGDATSPAALHRAPSQLLMSPLASAPYSSTLLSEPKLPALGLTPYPEPAALPLTASPTAPALILPPPYSPSTQALSPPVLSPCPSLTSLPLSQPPTSPSAQIQDPSQNVEPPEPPTAPGIQLQDGGMSCKATLKAPAGGRLVDVCCLPAPSGGFYVAAAGKWAVCLWSQKSESDWSLMHTWTFNKPVISVFPVPDAAELMCVTLGQLEITEVRLLSCSSVRQLLLCEGLVQAVVGMPKSRVVASSHEASGSALRAFTLSDCGSAPSSQLLTSPGVCVGALAPVDGLTDALIGTDEGGRLFVWNVRTGQLLRRIVFGDGLSHAACLRGYSDCGVLFVLLQHHFLCSLGEEEEVEATEKDQEQKEEKKKTALLSLVAINPLNGKSTPASRLYPPTSWSGRLCEADVSSCSVVGLSQSGCVCVWELGCRGASMMVGAPESEGWQLARWGRGDTLLTGHHNGDVTLHRYSGSVSLGLER